MLFRQQHTLLQICVACRVIETTAYNIKCVLYWLFFTCSISVYRRLALALISWQMQALVLLRGEIWIMESASRSSSHFTLCKCYFLKALFVIPVLQLSSPAELRRYCPVCANLCRINTEIGLHVRKLVWNQHIREHDTPWCLSVINYLCAEKSQETTFKDQLLWSFSFFFYILKGNVCIEYLCGRLW